MNIRQYVEPKLIEERLRDHIRRRSTFLFCVIEHVNCINNLIGCHMNGFEYILLCMVDLDVRSPCVLPDQHDFDNRIYVQQYDNNNIDNYNIPWNPNVQ